MKTLTIFLFILLCTTSCKKDDLEYDYATKITYTKKYWIDSLLHTAIQREDGRWFTFDFDCQFKGDTMRLERKNVSAIFNVSKHKRIN